MVELTLRLGSGKGLGVGATLVAAATLKRLLKLFGSTFTPLRNEKRSLRYSDTMAATGPENSVRTGETQIQKCKRCKENDSVVVVRHESLCRFVSSSVVGLYEPPLISKNHTSPLNSN